MNFGSGSSREHAPQALQKYGIRAVIAEGFAEIFYGNSATLGMPCVIASRADIEQIAAAVQADPQVEVVIDLVNQKIVFAGKSVAGSIRESARDALVNGRWDPIGELIEGAGAAAQVAARLPYMTA
jgi:3-isopropylmalate/(R)-2-methylmalate dehydratase small subunit